MWEEEENDDDADEHRVDGLLLVFHTAHQQQDEDLELMSEGRVCSWG